MGNQRLVSDLTRGYVRSIFTYKDGNLYWKFRPRQHFKNDAVFKRWNNRYPGNVAGSYTTRYRKVAVNGATYNVHRLIYLWHKGYIPKQIDHINGDRYDNRIENLRSATKFTNKWNAKISTTNKSGVRGVSFRSDGVWEAYINARNKRYYLGRFKKKSDAVRIIREYREKLHGKWARFS